MAAKSVVVHAPYISEDRFQGQQPVTSRGLGAKIVDLLGMTASFLNCQFGNVDGDLESIRSMSKLGRLRPVLDLASCSHCRGSHRDD